MPYLIQTGYNGAVLGVWKSSDAMVVRLGISNAENGPNTCFRATDGASALEVIRKTNPQWFEGAGAFDELRLAPGKYYRRMARPNNSYPHEAPGSNPGASGEANFIAIARAQLAALSAQLGRICQTVHPTQETFFAYGHDIRNLLILACTEVETHWRGTLAANGVRKRELTTGSYFALNEAMRLGEYAISFPDYPWLAPLRPFEAWTADEGPRWYRAYNAVKHDRETKFDQATLQSAFEAVSACAIMLCAQFGSIGTLRPHSELQAFFHFEHVPQWPFAEVYTPPYEGGGWTPTDYPFELTMSDHLSA